MKLIETLEHIGLTQKQAQVYLAALDLGKTSMTTLAKHAGLKRPNTYLITADLVRYGLVSETKVGKKRLYSAVHPRRLMQLVRFREKELEDVMPELAARFGESKDRPKIQVFEGLQGIQNVYRENDYSGGEEILWYSNASALEKIPRVMTEYKKIIREIRNPKVRELTSNDKRGREWAKELLALKKKNYQVRLLPKELSLGPTDCMIVGDKLIYFSLEKNLFAVVIESASVTESQKALFDWAWKSGVEVS